MATYFKAVRPSGTSFHDSTFRWLPEDGVIPEGGWLVEHPHPAKYLSEHVDASAYLSVASVESDCTGFSWPCRLLEVEAVGEVVVDTQYPNKRRGAAFRVVAELEAWRAFGPNGRQVVAFLSLLPSLSREQWDAARDAAWDAAWYAAREAARDAAWGAARDAARGAAWGAAWGAATALVLRDRLTPEQFSILTAPMRAAGIDFDALVVE